VGLDFVHLGTDWMTAWLWFPIGGSHVSDRLSRPHANIQVIREELF